MLFWTLVSSCKTSLKWMTSCSCWELQILTWCCLCFSHIQVHTRTHTRRHTCTHTHTHVYVYIYLFWHNRLERNFAIVLSSFLAWYPAVPWTGLAGGRRMPLSPWQTISLVHLMSSLHRRWSVLSSIWSATFMTGSPNHVSAISKGWMAVFLIWSYYWTVMLIALSVSWNTPAYDTISLIDMLVVSCMQMIYYWCLHRFWSYKKF